MSERLFHLFAVAAIVMGIAQTIAKEKVFEPLRTALWFLSSILVVVLAAFLRVGFWLVDESQGLIRRQQRTEEETAKLVKERTERIREGDEET